MKLAIDAMSGDLGSAPVVEACKKFAEKHPDVELYVTGKKEELTALESINSIHIVDARDVVLMTDSVLGVRRKKESSMVKALMMARKDEVDGVVSCGSTGAFYTASMLFVKRIEGVEKSCLMATLPTYSGNSTCLMDVGANATNTAEQLQEFAVMGSLYSKLVLNKENPKVSLLNIGAEDHKGDKINFTGNIEGRELLSGDIDVVVTDGFSGNIALKASEGAAILLMKAMKESLFATLRGKIGALFAKPQLYALKERFDYKSVGGALFMGFEKAIVKAHGGSDAKAVFNAMELVYRMVDLDVVGRMKEGLQ